MISTSTTTIHSTQYNNSYLHEKNTRGVMFNGSISRFMVDKKFDKDEQNVLNFISDKPKVFVSMTTSYYHLYHDCFGEFLTKYEEMPEAKFIIDITHIADQDKLPEYIKMIFKFLNDNNVDYSPVDFRKVNKFNINNFYYRNPASESFAINNPCERIYRFSQRYIKDKDAPATKKIFLSRKNYGGRNLEPLIKGRLPYQNDNRMDNEILLKEYLESLGFESVCPEDFKNFEEQMRYFYQAKIIVSTTSSGLTNAMFMRPGSTMIELMTPLISFSSLGNGVTQPASQGQEEIHHFYHAISLAMGHKFISIPNKDRSAEKVIEIIENDLLLKNLLGS